MLPISKLPEPPGLKGYKSMYPNSDDYIDFCSYQQGQAFTELRENLLKEQKFVCAYCGQRLGEDVLKMKTEHFEPQKKVKLTIETKKEYHNLNYYNLLACCQGNDDKKGENHCDSKKGQKPLHFIPNPATIQTRNSTIKYKVNPRSEEVLIFSTDPEIEKELNQTLNLNHQMLRASRFNQWRRVTKYLGDSKTWKAISVKQLIEEYQIPTNRTQHKEFKDFIIWYLNDWIRRFG